MTAPQDITPSTKILDDQGNDWTWAFVVHREVPGYPDYVVGTDGRVWSRRKNNKDNDQATNTDKDWHLSRGSISRQGYIAVNLRDGKGGGKYFRVSRLVLSTFIGPPAPGMDACHFPDRNPQNNNIRNLRWDTRKGNHQDRHEQGTYDIRAHGSRHGHAKLTEAKVRRIRGLYEQGIGTCFIARMMGVNSATIVEIVKGEIWRHCRGVDYGEVPEDAPRRERDFEETAHEVLQAAEELANGSGIRPSDKAIADRVGIARGSVKQYVALLKNTGRWSLPSPSKPGCGQAAKVTRVALELAAGSGKCPPFQEIADRTGIPKYSVANYITLLRKRGEWPFPYQNPRSRLNRYQ